jgi:hypothetical protein
VISVEYECDFPGCDAGKPEGQHHIMSNIPAGESVDVYLNDWRDGAKLSGYLPEGWTVRPNTHDGSAAVWCPAHPNVRMKRGSSVVFLREPEAEG